jgi:type IV secretory pathway VirB10-like protein
MDDPKNLPEESEFDKTPEEMTSIPGGPPWFNRQRVRLILAVAGSLVVILGLVVSNSGSSRKSSQGASSSGYASTLPREFLNNELSRALSEQDEYVSPAVEPSPFLEEDNSDPWGLPAVVEIPVERQPVVQVQQYPPQQQGGQREAQPQLSSLVPRVEGSLFSSSAPAAAPQAAPSDYDAYRQSAYPSSPTPATPDYSGIYSSLMAGQSPSEAAQDNKVDFYSGASGGNLSGYFLQDDALWIGTVIPAVLVTAINTDLPGNVIARVTQNVYDSRTGKNLLVPQGTLLVAQYNSSISFSQRRVQVVWDIMIRPDGYQVELEGMNGVDPQGMAGIMAQYKENWFEYVKAAGIISLFSVANAKLTEEVASRTSDEMAGAVVTSNAEFIRNIGGNLVSRATDIQPTLTVSSGERINVMLNKNVFLPPVSGYPVTQRYTLP